MLSIASGRWYTQRNDRSPGIGLIQAAVVVALIAGCTALILTVGRTHFVVIHFFYIPIILAAYWFRSRGGAAAGLAAGIAASPLFVASATPTDYADNSWIFRVAFLTGFGAFSGAISHVLMSRSDALEHMMDDLTHTYGRTLRSLMGLLEHHDEETSSHCERVARNALAVGRALGLDRAEREALYWAGYMHDVGKLATPARMLLKAGPLTDDEYAIVKQHAAIGADTIDAIGPAFHEVAEAIRCHHERWDGNGYPRGLAGDAIPLMGRILAVVDTFEAMTSDRPYRDALEAQEAQLLIQRESGHQFDPAILETFLDLLERGQIHVQKTHGKHTDIGMPVAFSPEFLTRAHRATN